MRGFRPERETSAGHERRDPLNTVLEATPSGGHWAAATPITPRARAGSARDRIAVRQLEWDREAQERRFADAMAPGATGKSRGLHHD